MTREELLNKLSNAEKQFRGSKYENIIDDALDHFNDGAKISTIITILDALPSKAILMDKLSKELKGKPVEKTLNKIAKGSIISPYEKMKGLFSLGTHICIEVEKGNLEYKILLEDVYSKIGELLFSL